MADLMTMKKQFEAGGLNAYSEECRRVTTVKIHNKANDAEGCLEPQQFIIDGEPYTFTHFFKVDVLKGYNEVIVDLDHILEKRYSTDRTYSTPVKAPTSWKCKLLVAALVVGAIAAAVYFITQRDPE